MADLNSTVLTVSIGLDAPAVDTQGFGVVLFAGTQEAGFSDRVRKYDTATDAAADTDLGANTAAAIAQAFSQSPPPVQVAAGKVEADQAKVMTITFTGDPELGDKLKITVGALSAEVTADSTTLADEVGDLRTALTTAIAALDVTVGGAAGVITLTADNAGEDFTASSLVTLTGTGDLASADVETTANRNLSTELDLIKAADSAWYGLGIESRAKAEILEAAAWADTNARLFLGLTADVDVLTSATDDVASTLESLSRRHAGVLCGSASEFNAFAALAKALAADPDEQTTIFAHKIIVGATKSTYTAAQRDYALAKNANVYMDFYGNGSLWQGRAADGTPLDVVVTLDWLQARFLEALAQELSDASNQNSKIPFTDAGRTAVEDVLRGVLKLGERVGHFTPGSTSVTSPKVSSFSSTQKGLRNFTGVTFVAELAGAIEAVSVSGSLVNSL